ncbi:MAG TPA: aspartate kinase, partial [Flavobacteriales bacterium]|nr:aspartate kinase [Flavobacteriales bacterium]
MLVFKFGGASVKDASAVKNVGEVMKLYSNEEIVVVVSAMGKMTNALEKLAGAYFYKKGNPQSTLKEIKDYHIEILNELFTDEKHSIYDDVNNILVELEWIIEDKPIKDYDFEYDQIVSMGEMISTKIVSAWLIKNDICNIWVDCRDFIKTDNTYREAKLNWEDTEACVNKVVAPLVEKGKRGIVVTQGFVGVTSENFNTTLGREGSDYSAAIIGSILKAKTVTIWKDVAGVLNADPKWFKETEKLDALSYHDAIELSFFGATIIHPKTLKPLQNRGIPLYVKSFYNPKEEGT